jgi:hypothetical protein
MYIGVLNGFQFPSGHHGWVVGLIITKLVEYK